MNKNYRYKAESKRTRGPYWDSKDVGQRTMRRIAILRAITYLTQENDGVAPTVSELSKSTGIPRSSVYRHLQSLAESELVEIGRGGRHTGVRISRPEGRIGLER